MSAHKPKPAPHQIRATMENVKIELPNGKWAEMRPVEDLRRGDKKAVLKAMDDAGANLATNEVRLSVIGAAQDALIIRFLVDWSLEDPETHDKVARTVEALQDLHQSDITPMEQHVAPLLEEMMGGGATATPTPLSEAPSSTSATPEA